MIECAVAEAVADLSAGRWNAQSIDRLYEHVTLRIVRWANRMLGKVPRRADDEEDIAINVFYTFCVLVSADQFGPLENLNQLWPILYAITRNKTSELRRYIYAQKRDARRLIEVDLNALPDLKPTGEQVTDWIDQTETLLNDLHGANLREVATLIYEGWTNREIADRFQRDVDAISRKRRRIREIWERDLRKWATPTPQPAGPRAARNARARRT